MRSREIQTARIRLSWSQARLARESGVDIASVYLLERLGTAGEEDDGKMHDAIIHAFNQVFRTASTPMPDQADYVGVAPIQTFYAIKQPSGTEHD